MIALPRLRKQGKVVRENLNARLVDLGDGVVGCEFAVKMVPADGSELAAASRASPTKRCETSVSTDTSEQHLRTASRAKATRPSTSGTSARARVASMARSFEWPPVRGTTRTIS